jgi:Zn finger protein HypA/HybF involved in hydrogenase expression
MACSPKYDWREVQGGEASYTVLMPDKPSRLSREIQLGQQTVTMHMTATQIDGVKFAIGAVKLANPTEAQTAMHIIKNTLVNNMAGKITQEKTTVTNAGGKLTINDEFDAVSADSSLRMSGRLVARDVWVYEVLVVGPQQAMNQDNIETFLSSFKPTH